MMAMLLVLDVVMVGIGGVLLQVVVLATVSSGSGSARMTHSVLVASVSMLVDSAVSSSVQVVSVLVADTATSRE